MTDRGEKYGRGIPKEEGGLQFAQRFLSEVGGVKTDRIDEEEANYREGDLRAGNVAIEVKRQPINPSKYAMNFIELFEITDKPRHADGFSDLATVLGVEHKRLEEKSYTKSARIGGGTVRLRPTDAISVSIHSILSAALTIYVSPYDGYCYVYQKGEIGPYVLGMLGERWIRGAGESNDATVAMFAPLSQWRWKLEGIGWTYIGAGDAEVAIAALRASLGT